MRYLFFIILYASCIFQNKAVTKCDDAVIDSIAYDYELQENGTKLDCYGTLIIYAKAPVDSKCFLLCFNVKESRPNFFRLKTTYSPTETVIEAPVKLRWDGNFILAYITESDEHIQSNTYYVKDLMNLDDLALLLNNSEIDSMDSDESTSINFCNQNISIRTSEQAFIQIVDISGRILFSGTVENEIEIPIHVPVVIVNIQSKNHTLTKKLLMR